MSVSPKSRLNAPANIVNRYGASIAGAAFIALFDTTNAVVEYAVMAPESNELAPHKIAAVEIRLLFSLAASAKLAVVFDAAIMTHSLNHSIMNIS